MIQIGYKRCEYDYYVDDMLIVAKTMIGANKLKALLSRKFDMKDLCHTTTLAWAKRGGAARD